MNETNEHNPDGPRRAWIDLEVGEIIRQGDEFWSTTSNEWKPAERIGVAIGAHSHRYRRSVVIADQSARIAELERKLLIERGEVEASSRILEDQDEEIAELKRRRSEQDEELSAKVTELSQLRADVERLTKERDEARAWQRISPYCACRFTDPEPTRVGIATMSDMIWSTRCSAHAHFVNPIEAERDTLRTQLAEREEDRALLDWLETQKTVRELSWGNGEGPRNVTVAALTRYISLGRNDFNLDTGEVGPDLPIPTLRAAIRAARAQPEDGK